MVVNPDINEPPVLDHPEVAGHGPSADGDPMGTPVGDERVLWKGKPDTGVLARTAFHTRAVALYFAALIGISLAFGNVNSAIVCAVLGVLGLAVLQGLAWLSARSTLYILTDVRLIMRIGMALETRINVPLKHISAAHLKMRGKTHGDIAMELNGERMLGYILMWPHVRPWRLTMPQPMLRAVVEPKKVADLLANACAEYAPIDRNLIEINEETHSSATGKLEPARTPEPAASLEGAPA